MSDGFHMGGAERGCQGHIRGLKPGKMDGGDPSQKSEGGFEEELRSALVC